MFLEDWQASPLTEAAALCEFLGLDSAKLPALQEGGTNRADQRRQPTPWAKFVGDSRILAPVRQLFPKALRGRLRHLLFNTPLGTRRHQPPEFSVSVEFRKNLNAFLKRESEPFLQEHGKPRDFWHFED